MAPGLTQPLTLAWVKTLILKIAPNGAGKLLKSVFGTVLIINYNYPLQQI